MHVVSFKAPQDAGAGGEVFRERDVCGLAYAATKNRMGMTS